MSVVEKLKFKLLSNLVEEHTTQKGLSCKDIHTQGGKKNNHVFYNKFKHTHKHTYSVAGFLTHHVVKNYHMKNVDTQEDSGPFCASWTVGVIIINTDG